MSQWTLYTLADWWRLRYWKWLPSFEHHERESSGSWLFFTIRRQWL